MKLKDNERTVWKYSWCNLRNKLSNSVIVFCECVMISVMVICLVSAIIMNTAAYWVFSFIVGAVAFVIVSLLELNRDHIQINDKLDKILIDRAKFGEHTGYLRKRYK